LQKGIKATAGRPWSGKIERILKLDKHIELLKKIRILSITVALGITVLSFQSLITGEVLFQNFANGLALFALVFITIMIAKTVKTED